MSGLSTHILDTSLGRPAAAIRVQLELHRNEQWHRLAEHTTDQDGRVESLLPNSFPFIAATYRLTFHTRPYFLAQGIDSLYPFVDITFIVRDPRAHHHIPLLLAANGYTTYRGS